MEAANTEQQTFQSPEPGHQHRWLHRLVGEWTYESDAPPPEPGQPSARSTGTEIVRSVGGLWVVAEGRGEMPGGGGPATTMMTVGFDPEKERFVGTWVGSMMTHLWIYDGELDPDEQTLTLHCEGPSMAGDGRMVPYQDVITFRDDDHRVLTARVQADDGEWRELMSVHYRRKK